MEDQLVEIQRLKDLVNSKPLPNGLKEELQVLLQRVSRAAKYGSYSGEYESASKYIHYVTSIPWGTYTEDNLDLENTKKILEEDHFGMDDVKDRVLEYIAIMNLVHGKGNKPQTPIICFVGLQGIGKTSMARSIAKALGRNFERISIGGMPSALELLGRSKATPDSEPGLIVKALIRSQSMNPVILLDEVEKSGSNAGEHASVMASLLEILDPEQNETFTDNYIGYPIDLSNVFFVLTANNLGPISAALLDRLEVIKLTGYTDEEKEVIAKKYLMPKMYQNSGFDESHLTVDDKVWPLIIRPLGYEAGIRELERVILGIGRRAAKRLIERPDNPIHVTEDNYKEYISSLL